MLLTHEWTKLMVWIDDTIESVVSTMLRWTPFLRASQDWLISLESIQLFNISGGISTPSIDLTSDWSSSDIITGNTLEVAINCLS